MERDDGMEFISGPSALVADFFHIYLNIGGSSIIRKELFSQYRCELDHDSVGHMAKLIILPYFWYVAPEPNNPNLSVLESVTSWFQ